jgi:Replication-relaxation
MRMKNIPVQKSRTKLLTLTSSQEKILRAIHFYRFMSAQDLCRLLYSPRSLSHVREILSNLVNSKYLFRFELPHTSRGNTEKIYTLSGSKGRDFLANELGLPVDWYFRPYKVKHLSYSQVLHNLVLTRFIVSVAAWCAKEPNFRLSQTRICYELARTPVTVEVAREGKIEKLKVIPDVWIEFERNNGMKFPILLEIDRGMEYGKKFMHHVRSRIEFIKSGAYRKMFSTDAVMIAYLTTGEMPEYRETRRKAMCVWTQEVLADLHMENWSHIYRFASVVFEDLYTTPLFDEPVWYRPDSATPVPLFTF